MTCLGCARIEYRYELQIKRNEREVERVPPPERRTVVALRISVIIVIG